MAEHDRNFTKKPSRQDELDNFWDIDRLIPERPARRTAVRPSATPSAVEIEILPRRTDSAQTVAASPMTVQQDVPRREPAPAESEDSLSTTRYVPPHTADEGAANEPLVDYHPDGVLIHRVRVFEWQTGFHYFDSFAADAAAYDMRPAPTEARPESFFSYFPQYVQMNRRQAAWYLYWREQVRRGVFPDTDYAYVLLYIFELINLPVLDVDTAWRRRDSLAAVWVAYRRSHPQLDHYMCEWLCDYCLIHALPAPLDLLAPALDAIIEGSRLKEFYLASVIEPTSDGAVDRSLSTARILMRHCCQYDYRKSKFAQGEHKPLFDRIIPAAVAACLPLLLGADGRPPVITMLESTVTRDAYTGALCSYRNKRRIEVAYTSFSRSHELRFLIGDMVKHVENRLRSWMGVRSRLSVMSLPIPLRDALDAYLNPLAPPKSHTPVKKNDEPRPAYEALYDLPAKPLSLADAAAIEQSSWETTRILTEAFDGEGMAARPMDVPASVFDACPTNTPEASTMPSVTASDETAWSAPPASSKDTAFFREFTPFVVAALNGDHPAQRSAAATLRKMPDAIAEAVNALTTDAVIFDMILEDDGTGFYAVVEDYRGDVRNLLPLQ